MLTVQVASWIHGDAGRFWLRPKSVCNLLNRIELSVECVILDSRVKLVEAGV